MSFFPSTVVTLFEEVEDPKICGTDGYGRPLKCLVEQGSVMGDFQPMSPSEAQKEFGEMVQGMYKLYLDYGVTITSKYKVQVEGYEGYFQVKGEPMQRNTLIPHVKVLLAREGL